MWERLSSRDPRVEFKFSRLESRSHKKIGLIAKAFIYHLKANV